MLTRAQRFPFFTLVTILAAPTLAAQVSITPRTVEPADLVRFAVQVANPTDTADVAVRVEVPEALAVLGIDTPPGWTARLVAASDSTPQAIEWSGGRLARREFREFAFFGRLGANAPRTTLFFPVRIGRADGSVREWRRGGYGQAPEVEITGDVGLTTGAAFTRFVVKVPAATAGWSVASSSRTSGTRESSTRGRRS